MLYGQEGRYFIRGQYVAIQAGDGGPWRVSKMDHDPTNLRVMTLTLVGDRWSPTDAESMMRLCIERDTGPEANTATRVLCWWDA